MLRAFGLALCQLVADVELFCVETGDFKVAYFGYLKYDKNIF